MKTGIVIGSVLILVGVLVLLQKKKAYRELVVDPNTLTAKERVRLILTKKKYDTYSTTAEFGGYTLKGFAVPAKHFTLEEIKKDFGIYKAVNVQYGIVIDPDEDVYFVYLMRRKDNDSKSN